MTELPPNPYIMQPQRDISKLPGRREELNEVSYYFSLTAAGQNPHIALIGARGVGKTSLLNASELIAKEKQLLPVRFDLDQGKTVSPGVFWRNFYISLVNKAATIGCWGGLQGVIYQNLYKMLFAGVVDAPDKAVLQFPFALAYQLNNLDNLICSDDLIINDLNAVVDELQYTPDALKGIIFLIDEANCLKDNYPLLQMFRNVFQRVNRCSLVFAGTKDVFPAISEVFSPIPRQFHRINIEPFADWSGTVQLISSPLADASFRIRPDFNTASDLHYLCGGDPTELQTYCHQMYKLVEQGVTNRMQLHPVVFKRVLEAYRASTDENLMKILRAVGELPESLLFESWWLSYRNLTVTEAIQLAVLKMELASGTKQSQESTEGIAQQIRGSYKQLTELGIVEGGDSPKLVGDPVTSGFWKSYVEAEKQQRWVWISHTYAQAVEWEIVHGLTKATKTKSAAVLESPPPDVNELELLRKGEALDNVDPLFVLELMRRTPDLRRVNESLDYDCFVTITQVNRLVTIRLAGTADLSDSEFRDVVINWVAKNGDVLSTRGIAVRYERSIGWQLPTDKEIHILARFADVHADPDLFGPDQMEQSLSMYRQGRLKEVCHLYEEMLALRNDPDSILDANVRNNLCFCLLLQNEAAESKLCYENIDQSKMQPLELHNYALSLALSGDNAAAAETLKMASAGLDEEDTDYDTSAFCMLLLSSDAESVNAVDGIPIRAALLINLHRLGAISLDDIEEQIRVYYPDTFETWLQMLRYPEENSISNEG